MKPDKEKRVNGIVIGDQFSKALNEIENRDFGSAEGYANWFEAHGLMDQAKTIREKISLTETETELEQKCAHVSTTTKTHRDGGDPYGYWLISAVVCDHCSEELETDRKYIVTKPKPKSIIAAESMPETPDPESKPEPETEMESEPETEKEKAIKKLKERFEKAGSEVYIPEPETPEPETETPETQTITPEICKYWYSHAKKDISEGDIDAARNLLKWFKDNNQKRYSNLLEKAIEKAISETETPDPEPEPETETPDPEPETETEPDTPETPVGNLKATIDKKIIRAFVDPMAVLGDEIKATITDNGISVKLVDPAHVAMLETTIEKRAFTEYKASDFELGLDLDKVQSFLKKGDQKKGAYISVDYDGDHNKTIWGNGINNRTITAIDISGISDPKVPNLNLYNTFTMDRKTLFEAIKEAEEVSDHVELISGPEGIEINAEGDTDNTTAKIPKALLYELDAREKARSLYPLDYLEAIVKAIKSETVTIEMGTDYPLKMIYEYEGIKGLYLLAPRIESD